MITLNFNSPEIEQGLRSRASARGMSLEEYVLDAIRSAPAELAPQAGSPSGADPEARADAFEAWAAGHRPTQPLSDYAISRESIYDHLSK